MPEIKHRVSLLIIKVGAQVYTVDLSQFSPLDEEMLDSKQLWHELNVHTMCRPGNSHQDMAPVLVEILLYGLYTALFSICIYLLWRAKKLLHVPFLVAVIIMYGLATADVVLTVRFLFLELAAIRKDETIYKVIFFLINDVVANLLLIYRLYMLWDRRKRVIIVPCIVLTAGTITSIVSYSRVGVLEYLAVTMSVNIITSILLATRIVWIMRTVTRIMGPGYTRRQSFALALILESGVLSVAYVLLASIRGVVPFSDGLVQVVGIAPTLVIVQIGLGREMQDLDTTLRSVSVDFDRNSLITPFAEELREAEVSWQQDNSSIEITGGNLRPRKDEGPR